MSIAVLQQTGAPLKQDWLKDDDSCEDTVDAYQGRTGSIFEGQLNSSDNDNDEKKTDEPGTEPDARPADNDNEATDDAKGDPEPQPNDAKVKDLNRSKPIDSPRPRSCSPGKYTLTRTSSFRGSKSRVRSDLPPRSIMRAASDSTGESLCLNKRHLSSKRVRPTRAASETTKRNNNVSSPAMHVPSTTVSSSAARNNEHKLPRRRTPGSSSKSPRRRDTGARSKSSQAKEDLRRAASTSPARNNSKSPRRRAHGSSPKSPRRRDPSARSKSPGRSASRTRSTSPTSSRRKNEQCASRPSLHRTPSSSSITSRLDPVNSPRPTFTRAASWSNQKCSEQFNRSLNFETMLLAAPSHDTAHKNHHNTTENLVSETMSRRLAMRRAASWSTRKCLQKEHMLHSSTAGNGESQAASIIRGLERASSETRRQKASITRGLERTSSETSRQTASIITKELERTSSHTARRRGMQSRRQISLRHLERSRNFNTEDQGQCGSPVKGDDIEKPRKSSPGRAPTSCSVKQTGNRSHSGSRQDARQHRIVDDLKQELERSNDSTETQLSQESSEKEGAKRSLASVVAGKTTAAARRAATALWQGNASFSKLSDEL